MTVGFTKVQPEILGQVVLRDLADPREGLKPIKKLIGRLYLIFLKKLFPVIPSILDRRRFPRMIKNCSNVEFLSSAPRILYQMPRAT